MFLYNTKTAENVGTIFTAKIREDAVSSIKQFLGNFVLGDTEMGNTALDAPKNKVKMLYIPFVLKLAC